jgi:hypothetical protein
MKNDNKRLIHNNDINPFGLGSDVPIKVFVKKGEKVKAEFENGEKISGATVDKPKYGDGAAFCKVFKFGAKRVREADSCGKDLFLYIVEVMPQDIDWLILKPSEVVTGMELSSDRNYYKGINELVRCGVIAKGKSAYKYFINILCLFNGDRAKFVEKYITEYKKLPPNIRFEYENR